MFRFFYDWYKISIYFIDFLISDMFFKVVPFNNHSKIILKIYLR